MDPAARLADLPSIEAAIWRELDRAVHDKSHGWRVAVLATTDGRQAEARSVVLREFDAGSRTLLIYTDARSAKAQQIATHPQGTLVLWCAKLGWQLRLRASLALQTEGLQVSSRWARLKLTPAAQDYLSPLPPGAALDAPAPQPQRESRAHFAVLVASLASIDWLELHALGHRRAGFAAAAAGRPWTGRWLVP